MCVCAPRGRVPGGEVVGMNTGPRPFPGRARPAAAHVSRWNVRVCVCVCVCARARARACAVVVEFKVVAAGVDGPR